MTNMKYELNEQIKVALDERLLLVEADDNSTKFDALAKETLTALQKYDNQFRDKLLDIARNETVNNNAQKAFNKNINYKTLKTAEETAKQAIEHGALDKIQAPVSDYTEAVRDIVRSTNGTGNGNPLSSVPNLSRNLDLLDALAEKLTDPNISNVDKQQVVLDLSTRFDDLTSKIRKALDDEATKKTVPQSDIQKKLEEGILALFEYLATAKKEIERQLKSKANDQKPLTKITTFNAELKKYDGEITADLNAVNNPNNTNREESIKSSYFCKRLLVISLTF